MPWWKPKKQETAKNCPKCHDGVIDPEKFICNQCGAPYKLVVMDFFQSDTSDVIRNFLDYCGAYFIERCGLSAEQASLLVLDPELGPDLDKEKWRWLIQEGGLAIDPDLFLVPKLYDAPELAGINRILDEYAAEFQDRKQKISIYLKSKGLPYEF